MGTPQIVLLGLGSVVSLVLIILFAARAVARGVAARTRALIEHHFPVGSTVRSDDMAQFFGLESRGAVQMRGNGGLVLTRDELCFLPLVGDAALRIPRRAIRVVSEVRSHLGKTVGRPLLRVEYEGEGGPDAVAWFVNDVSAWRAELSPQPANTAH